MAETIYTIPVNEAFETDCECPICELRKRFEKDSIDYFAGPSLMEPDTREMTNEVGFCGRHFEQLYGSEAKKLGIGLMLDTYMVEQMSKIEKHAKKPQDLVKYLTKKEQQCAVCEKLNYTMDRYLEITFHLYKHDDKFRAKFFGSKGFCLPHFRILLEMAPSKLGKSGGEEFARKLTEFELENLKRIEGEVDWFTKKFDYRNQNADWGNSRDALPRGILKMSGAKDIIK